MSHFLATLLNLPKLHY